ncbi:transducin beta-like protein 3 [Patiria miniata]|uniref:U3 small nucleolar RNA-associated protein 13 C-terminal domain-containing protein n=1 Tax=Patiria miniata TaxID=46514 RepID=A0A914ALX9_PATMI|nr:transducin beta-like protein 3 [Patiria miniata]
MAAIKLKTNFRVENRISAFYTGGKVHLSRDGNHVFCVHGANINVIETTSGKVVHSIKAEDCDDVTCFAVTPDDEFLVVAHRNLLLKQWDWKEERCVRTWKAIHIGPVVSMTFDPTSTLLATGSSDGTIKLWDIVRQYCTHNLKGSQGVVSVVEFHPESEKLLLFSAADDCKIRVWDLKTSRCKAVLESHYSGVTSFAFTEDGQTMYSAGRDNIVTVWDLDSYTVRKTVPVYEPLESVIVPPSDVDCSKIGIAGKNAFFITAGSQGVLKVWDASTAKCVFTQQQQLLSHTHQEGQEQVQAQAEVKGQAGVKGQEQQLQTHINQAILCSALGVIAVVTYDHNILLFGLKEFELEKQFVGYNEEILDLCFMGEKDSHIAVASNSEQIRVFELSSLSCQILPGHTDIVLALQVFKNGSMLVSSSKDNTVRVWCMDPTSGSVHCVAVGKGHTHSVGAVATARLSSSFFVSGSEDCTIKVWTIPSNLSAEKTATPAPLHVRFTERAHEKDINSVAVSPNDKLLATGSQDRTARLWHLEKETSLGSFRGHRRGIWCVQFSPTDQALATSSADGTIRIWALSDFSCVKTFEGHDASVLKVTFLSRGMQLVSCGSDGLLKLWTIKSNECVKTFDEHTQKVWALAANRGQDSLVSGGGDSNILVWKDITEIEQEEEIEKEEEQILKEQELSNLLHEKKYLKAIGLAITLNQPYRVLTIMKSLLDEPDGEQKLEKTMKKMRPDQIESVLGFCKHWNTNSKHCHTAQTVIAIILRHVTPDDLMTFTTMQQTLEGLIPYTERHFERMNRLLQQAMFVEYTWQRMRRATGPVETGFVAKNSVELAEGSASFVIDTTPAVLSPSVLGGHDLGQSSKGKSGDSTGHMSDDDEEATHVDEDDINDEEVINERHLKEVTNENDETDLPHVERTDASKATKKPKTPKEKSSKRRKTKTNSDTETVTSPKLTPKLLRSKLKKTAKMPKKDSIGSDGTTDEGPSDHEEEGGLSCRTRSRDTRPSTAKTSKKSPGAAKKRLGKTPSSVKSAKKAKVAGLSMSLRS